MVSNIKTASMSNINFLSDTNPGYFFWLQVFRSRDPVILSSIRSYSSFILS